MPVYQHIVALWTHCLKKSPIRRKIVNNLEQKKIWFVKWKIWNFPDPQAVSLHAMVNLTIFANKNRRKLNKYFLCVDILEPLLQRLGSCSNLEEFHKITVCLSFLNRIITHDLMEVIKTKVEVLLKSGQLNSNSDKAIILAVILRIWILKSIGYIFIRFTRYHFRSHDSWIWRHGHLLMVQHCVKF